MKLVEGNGNLTLKVENKYSDLRYSKSDIKLNKKRKKQFTRIKKSISLLEKVEKNTRCKWIKTPVQSYKKKLMSSKKYDSLKRCFTDDFSIKKESEKFSQNEIIPETIIIFDLFPKEYIGIFSKKYIKFREDVSSSGYFLGQKSIKDIISTFNKMGTRFSTTSFYTVDYFAFDKKHELSRFFKSMILYSIDISPSFSSMSYRLELSEEMISLFNKLATNEIYRDGHYIDNGKKNSMNYNFHLGGTNSFSKSETIKDYICELKYEFLKFIRKYLISKLDDLNIVLPSVMIYKTNNLQDMVKNRLKLNSIGIKSLDLFHNIEHGSYIEIPRHLFNDSSEKFNIFNTLVDVSSYQRVDIGSKVDGVYNSLVYHFSEYYILGALLPEYDKRISKTNEKINLMLQSKNKSFGSLIKLRKISLSNFHLFDRLIREMNKKTKETTKSFNMHGELDYMPVEKKGNSNTYSKQKEILNWRLERSKEGIEEINTFFDHQLKTVESYSNFKIVKISLWVAFLSLIVAIVALILSNDGIMNWIEGIFTSPPTE